MGTLLGLAVSKETLIYSSVFTFALLMTIMTNVCQYFYNFPPRSGSRTPLALMICATVLLLLSPLKNMAVNICMASFKQHGYDATIGHVLDFAYRPYFGEWLMKVYTSVGYALMIVGTILQVELLPKLQQSMHQARSSKSACLVVGAPDPAEEGC